MIEARDGHPERIACGAGQDEADNDFIDIIAECERGIDGDRDGFSTAVDCNDAAAGIFPGAAEVFDNGVDENCDGRDNPNLDVDRDGFARPLDCDDGNAAVRPTAPEIRGNAVDENCDKRAEPFADLGAVVANQWVFGRRVRAPAEARRPQRAGAAPASCSAAPGAAARRGARCAAPCSSVLSRVVLHRGLRKARLRPGTKLVVTITAAETVGRTYTYVVKRGGAAREHDRLPRARRDEGAAMLRARRARRVAAVAARAAGHRRRPATSRSQGSRSSTPATAGVDQIAGFDTGTQHPLHPLRRREPRRR